MYYIIFKYLLYIIILVDFMVTYPGEEKRKNIANKIAYGLPEKLQWPPYRWEVFAIPYMFLQECAFCYINGFYNASALMARTSLEAAIYLSISTDIYAEDNALNKVDLSLTDERDWTKLINKAKKLKYVVKQDVENINFVRYYGNMIAHWGQKVHSAAKIAKSTQTGKSYIKGSHPFTFVQTVPEVNLNKFIVTEAKATTIQRKCVKVLMSMADRI